jgi:hypothetical protein
MRTPSRHAWLAQHLALERNHPALVGETVRAPRGVRVGDVLGDKVEAHPLGVERAG